MIGHVVDRVKRQGFVLRLLMISACLTLLCYCWLASPPEWTKTPVPAIVSFASGHGFAPLLLVVIVPQLVPHKYISTTLGAHKALEQTGSTIFQTLAGVALDIKSKKPATERALPAGDDRDVQYLLNAFVILNVLQLAGIVALARLDRKQRETASRRLSALLPPALEDIDEEDPLRSSGRAKEPAADEDGWPQDFAQRPRSRRASLLARSPLPSTSSPEQRIPLLRAYSESSSRRSSRYLIAAPPTDPSGSPVRVVRTKAELRRGEIFATLSGLLIFFAWVLFIATAWLRLRSKEERGADITLHWS